MLELERESAAAPVVLEFACSASGAGTRVELAYQGWELLAEPGTQLRAFRARPASGGPRPAVAALATCR